MIRSAPTPVMITPSVPQIEPSNGQANRPVFIVGNPRSGTTLLASLFDRSEIFACGPETGFFKPPASNIIAALDNWPQSAADMVCSLELHGERVHDLYGIDRESVLAHLRRRPPSARAMLESLTAVYADRHGKRRWVEKTPNHLAALGAIRAEFPNAVIVEITRHPVASAVGMCRLPWATPSAVANAYLLNDAHWASERFLATDHSTMRIRYEDLVADPAGTLAALFEALGEAFDPAVLTTTGSPELIAAAETSKHDSLGAVDPEIGERWRAQVQPGQAAAISVICDGYLQAKGYERIEEPAAVISAYSLDWKTAIEEWEALEELSLRGVVIAAPPTVFHRHRIAITWRPGDATWRSTLAMIGRIAFLVFRSALHGERVILLHRSGATRPHPRSLLHKLLIRSGIVQVARLADLTTMVPHRVAERVAE